MEEYNKINNMDIEKIGIHLSGNIEKYVKRFEKIEEEKTTFNICAAIFSNLWLAYQFLFSEWLIITFLGLAIDFLLTLGLIWDFNTKENLKLISYCYYIIKFFFFGFFGDRLLYRSIKKRIENNRKGKYGFRTMMTASEKTIVFRGFSVFACAICMILSMQILQVMIDWIVY